MGELERTTVSARPRKAGRSNFLIPNGTFFFVLIIFLIVLGVIGKFVVPPISKVLREREEMVAKTTEDNRQAATGRRCADADYQKAMAGARTRGVRRPRRGPGRGPQDRRRHARPGQ